jgi:hypothetical protein
MRTQKKSKTATIEQNLRTIYGWSLALKCDRATLTKALFRVPPDKTDGVRKLYRLKTVEAALSERRKGENHPLRTKKLAEEVRKLRLANDEREKLTIRTAWVIEVVRKITAAVDEILEQKLVNEYPAAVAGMDIPQCQIFGKRLGDAIRLEFKKLAYLWKEPRS